MPRDWQNDEIAVQRWCTCRWERIHAGTTVNEDDVIVGDQRLNVANPRCKLHGDNPADNLPEGIP